MRRPPPGRRLAAVALACVACVAAGACGENEPSLPHAPPSPSARDVTPTTAAPGVSADAPASVTFRQIMVLYRPTPGAKRSKDEAYALAKSLIARLVNGEKMELLLQYSDDLDEKTGTPYNSGSVTLAKNSPAIPAVKKAAFSTPIGQVAREPIDAGLAFIVLKRDA